MDKKLISLFTTLVLCTAGCKNEINSSDSDDTLYNLNISEITYLRDVCVMADAKTNKYYMIGFQNSIGVGSEQDIPCYVSKDLINWSEPTIAMHNNGRFIQTWAPEIHNYQDGYYLFANLQLSTLDNSDIRGCYILKSNEATGEYETYSERLTPENWQCLDGTLYVEDGIPYLIYCREWIRLVSGNGEMYYVRLKSDLSSVYPNAEHIKMFSAKDHLASDDGVTDGPYMYKANNGDLVMLWSKYIDGKYAIISSRSKSGKIKGPWIHDTTPLYIGGGHAMVFKDFEDNLRIAFALDDATLGYNHPVIYYLDDNNGILSIKEQKE